MKTVFMTIMFVAYLSTLIGLGCLMGGCQEAAYRINDVHGFNCRPEVIRQYGSCLDTRGARK